MKNNDISILLLEDNSGDARLVIEMLKDSKRLIFKTTHVVTLKAALEKISGESFNIVLLDLDVPDSRGLETLDSIVKQAQAIPVIVLTGNTEEEIGLRAIQRNASDYLVKGDINTSSLVRSIGYAIERKAAREALEREKTNLQMIFDAVNVGMLLLDEEGIVRRFNKAIAVWVGRVPGTICEDSPGDILGCIHAFDERLKCGHTSYCAQCPIRKIFKTVLTSGKSIHGVEVSTVLMLNGKRVPMWFEISVDPLVIEGRKHAILSLNDITERKRAEEELHKLNRTLRALSESSQAMTYAKSESDYLREVCRIVVETCGHSMVWIGYKEDDAAKTVRPVIQFGFDEGYIKALDITWADTERGRGPTGTAIRTAKPAMCRNILTEPNFKPWREEAIKRGYASSIVLPLMENEKVFGAISIYSKEPDPFSQEEIKLLEELSGDLAYGIRMLRIRAENIEAEKILRRDKETLEALVKERSQELIDAQMQLDRAKRLSDIGTLAATIAHELRNPLAAINMASSNIKRKAQNPLLDRHLENIEKKVNESDQIISNLLYYSRIKPPHYEDVNVNEVINECSQSLQKELRFKKKISIMRRISLTKGKFIEADPIQMKEILINILNNSRDALPDSGGKIEIVTENKEEFIMISIKDSGTGINKEHLEKVFEPFFTTKTKGTGLGLAVCRQIVELHGGTIKIESSPGEGTNVSITLPSEKGTKDGQ